MPFRIETNIQTVSETKLGILLPFNGRAVFNSSYTTKEQVRSNLINLLLTRKTERVMNPNFGSNIPDLLFEPSTLAMAAAAESVIRKSINEFIPNIIIDKLSIITHETDPSLEYQIQIKIYVTINRTNEQIKLQVSAKENGMLEIEDLNEN